MANKATKTATLAIEGVAETIELPIYEGTVGPDVIDVGKLTSHGYFTYDPGFVSTAACDSEITYIDGDAGILLHRGYPIDQLADQSDYLELCYLLLPGAARRVRQHHQESHHGARAAATLFQRFSSRCTSNGHHVRRGWRVVGVLSRLNRH